MNKMNLIAMLTSVALLQGCVAAAGVVVVSGASMATDERSIGKQLDDQSIELSASRQLSQNEAISDQTNLSVVVINGSLLVVGQAPTRHLKDQAIAILNETKDVVQIHDHIRLGNKVSLTTKTNDSWITTKVKSKLFASDEFDATNIKVVTENAEVFLMGIVPKKEADAAVEITRHVKGVSRVYKMFEYL